MVSTLVRVLCPYYSSSAPACEECWRARALLNPHPLVFSTLEHIVEPDCEITKSQFVYWDDKTGRCDLTMCNLKELLRKTRIEHCHSPQ
jgi:hypothetical protein